MALPKVKKRKPRAAPRLQRGAKLKEPSWEGWEEWSGEQIHRFRRHTHDWYYEHFKRVDLYDYVYEWMKQTDKYTEDQIRWVKAAPNHALSITASIVARMDMMGAPRLSNKESEYWDSLPGTSGQLKSSIDFLERRIQIAIDTGKEAKKEKDEEIAKEAKKPVISIQDRILAQAYSACEKIDIWLDGFVEDPKTFKIDGLDIKKHFIQMKVTQAHARKIKDIFQPEWKEINDWLNMPTPAQLKKMDEHTADMWEQLKEGYSHRTKKEMTLWGNAIDKVLVACDMIIESAKATRRPRKAKVYSAEKLVAKLKYKKQDDKYNLVSINPADIIYAHELWVFNTKTRKIGKYVAKDPDPQKMQRPGSGLQVKGTTITGFHEEESIQKTLRKPEEQLKEFKSAGKVALRKFMDDIKTTDTKLNGRINPETILLKVI